MNAARNLTFVGRLFIMMMASRRASAIRAFRRVDRLAIANAQSFNFSGPL
jgi:hypothetical protein